MKIVITLLVVIGFAIVAFFGFRFWTNSAFNALGKCQIETVAKYNLNSGNDYIAKFAKKQISKQEFDRMDKIVTTDMKSCFRSTADAYHLPVSILDKMEQDSLKSLGIE